MGKNKVVFGNNSIIDLTDATMTENDLRSGASGYDRNGNLLNGTWKLETETVDFTEAQDLANITSGDTVSTLFGKIRRWFSSNVTSADEVKVTVPHTGWATITINNQEFYYKDVTVEEVLTDHPDVFVAGNADIVPSAAEQSAFDSIKYVYADTVNNTLRFFANSAPTTQFYVWVRGVTA